MSDVLTAVRKKYPAYKDTPDEDLIVAIGNKFPAYLQRDKDFAQEFSDASTPETIPGTNEITPYGGMGTTTAPVRHIPLPDQSKTVSLAQIANKPMQVVGGVVSDLANTTADMYNQSIPVTSGLLPPITGKMEAGKALVAPETLKAIDRMTPLGYAVEKLAEVSPMVKGLNEARVKAVSGFTTPENALLLPFAAARPIQALFGAQMALSTPEVVKAAQEVLTDPKATTEQKWEAMGDAGVHLAMLGGIAMHLTPAEVKKLPPEEVAKSVPETPAPVITPEVIAPIAPLTAQALKETIVETPKAELEATNEQLRKTYAIQEQKPNAEVLRPTEQGASGNVELQGMGALDTQLGESSPKGEVAPQPHQGTSATENVAPLNPGGALKDLSPELQAKSNAVKEKMAAEFEALKAKAAPEPAPESTPEPTPLPPEQTLGEASKVKVSVPKGATQIRVTTKDGKVAIRPIADVNKGDNMFRGVDIKKIEAGTIGRDKKFVPMEGDISVADKTPIEIIGMGGARPGEVPPESQLKQLASAMREAADSKASLPDKVGIIDNAKDAIQDAGAALTDRWERSKAVTKVMWDGLTKRPEWTDEKQAVGDWTYANQKADFEAREFGKEIKKVVPDKLRREAMTNWIQAEGNDAVLAERASKSKGSIKRGYEMALKLTDNEKHIARQIGQYFEAQLEKGEQAGILESGIENYVNQVWKRENPVTRAIKSDFSAQKLQPNFRFAKQRIFDSYFQGEQLGFKPANKDVGALVALYDQAFNKSIAARGFLRALHEGKGTDGRPLVEVSGSGRMIEGQGGERSLEQPKSLMIKPYSKAEEIGDYRSIDHPAMRGWKWVQTMPDGTKVLMQGQLLVHPEAYTKLRNRLQESAWRTYSIGGIKPGKMLLETQSAVKQTMLSVSGFHQVQETLHALGHRVNPFNLDKIDFDNPTTKGLVTHGLQLADYHAMEMFGEGLASGSLLNKIPVLGKRLLQPYTEYLFQDFIPRLKLTMANHALERNISRYGDKLSKDQILELTAEQANAAFGELNYKFMGRSPSLQDTLRAFLLAPDFLEARARFVGQSVKGFGREQLVALGLLAATQYITARIFNKVLDDDYHWEAKNAFTYFYKGKAYTLRTIPGDLIHLFSDLRGFAFHRLSPLISRTTLEAITGRDDRGVKRDALEQVKDMAKTVVPISFKIRDDVKLWEAFLSSFGVGTRRYTAVKEINELAAAWKQKNLPPAAREDIYNPEKDVYRPLRLALEDDDVELAHKEYVKLRQQIPGEKIDAYVDSHYDRKFSGSAKNESAFVSTLSADQLKKYRDAIGEMKQAKAIYQQAKTLR